MVGGVGGGDFLLLSATVNKNTNNNVASYPSHFPSKFFEKDPKRYVFL